MPLIQSGSRDAVSANIREMMASGHPRNQSVAAALDVARRQGAKLAAGGSTGAPQAPTYATAAPAVMSSGLVPVAQPGSYNLDGQTGALTPQTQAALQSYAQRGLPGSPTGLPQPTADQASQAASEAALQAAFNQMFGGGGGDGAQGSMKRGGRANLAVGGVPSNSEMAPWFTRSEAHSMDHPGGLIHTAGPGRTDNVPLSVAAGSHVIPADVMAGLGEGNTLAGAHAMDMALSTGPGGIRLPMGPHRSNGPKGPRAPRVPRGPSLGRARGGEAGPSFDGHVLHVAQGSVPEAQGGIRCIVAGGEYLLRPAEVARITHGTKKGHDAVDAWILERRKKDIKKISSLPGPVK